MMPRKSQWSRQGQNPSEPITQPSIVATYGRFSTNMQQRVRRFHRGQSPSSVRQLPIMTALHAENPTLFAVHVTSTDAKSKYLIFNIVTL